MTQSETLPEERMRKTITVGPAVIFTVLLAAFSLYAPCQTRIGEVVPVYLESPHPVVGTWRGEISVPGAALLKVHLGASDLGPSDVLRVLDASGNEVHRQVGCERWGGWLPSVAGDRVTLEVVPAPGSHPWGLRVEEAAAGRMELLQGVPESVCNLDDRKNAACYDDAGKRTAGDAVGRLSFVEGGGMYLCTGSLISPQGHLLTNNHCVSTPAGAASLEVWWRYQYSLCAGGSADKESLTRGASLLITDYTLDFSLLQFTSENPAQRYGNLIINPAEPVHGEAIWIPQHPYGNPKTFAVVSDMDGGGPASIQLATVAGNAADTDIGYYADTQGGSSGSPVLRQDNTLVALHHWGTAYGPCTATDMNQGVKMSLIYPLIQPYLETCTVACTATVPAEAIAGTPIPFAATAGGTNCSGQPTYLWDFGDGSQSTVQNPTHTYSLIKDYIWVLTVEWAGKSCTQSGTINAADPGGPKPGDCDGDGTVSIGEVQKAINMFLGLTLPACGVDCNGDGTVSIGEVQKVINGFLGLVASC
jgi:hypothetical protein